MKVAYTGRQVELAPAQLKKIQARLAKVGKLLDGREEREAHVILSLERHLHNAEITVNYHNHQLAGESSSPDLFTAIHSAAEKLEKQALKVRTKWRDTKRAPKAAVSAEPEEAAAPEPEAETEGKVFRVDRHKKRKPMTMEEAILEMEKGGDYVVYQDTETDRLCVLVRRPDGNFDLVQG